MIKRYKLGNYSYNIFCESFKDNLVEEKEFKDGNPTCRYRYSVFSINNSVVTLLQERGSSIKELTIGLDEKIIDKTVDLINLSGFDLEERIR